MGRTLSHFDFNVLDDPEFKEDAVREEIVYPILRALDYMPSGNQKVVRSKSLLHPFVYIGSQKKNIYIIPDYTLYYNDQPIMIIDAKSPTENIVKSGHVEQVYSYSIHPDIRCDNYALCNGKRLSVFNIRSIKPIAVIDIEENKNNIDIFYQYLSPEYIFMPEKRMFFEDFGLMAFQAGLTGKKIHFFDHCLQLISMIEKRINIQQPQQLYLVLLNISSLDFDETIMNEIIAYSGRNLPVIPD